MIDTAFGVDIIVNFCSTYVSPDTGLVIVDRWKIAKNYMCGSRFFVDVLASFPFEILLPSADAADTEQDDAQVQRFQQLTGLFKLIRLLRLGRIVTFMKMRQDFKLGFRIVSLVSMFLLLIHWLGCILFIFVEDKETSFWLPPFDLNWQTTEFYNYSNE